MADNQLGSQKPLIADFNGDGIDDLYISSASRTERSQRNDGQFFGGWHSYYLSQPDGTFKESSREMMKGKWVERKTGRYTEFAHRSTLAISTVMVMILYIQVLVGMAAVVVMDT